MHSRLLCGSNRRGLTGASSSSCQLSGSAGFLALFTSHPWIYFAHEHGRLGCLSGECRIRIVPRSRIHLVERANREHARRARSWADVVVRQLAPNIPGRAEDRHIVVRGEVEECILFASVPQDMLQDRRSPKPIPSWEVPLPYKYSLVADQSGKSRPIWAV